MEVVEKEKIQVIVTTAPWGIGAYKFLDEEGLECMGYGFYRPENPNDFFPDQESCGPEEIEAHRKACEWWNTTHPVKS